MNMLGKVKAFDKNAEGYNKNSNHQYTEGKKTISYAVQNAEQMVKDRGIKKLRVLDAGCGNGRTTLDLYLQLKNELCKITEDIYISLVGVDISKNMLMIAEQRAVKEDMPIVFYNKNLEELSEEDGKFDIIFSNFVLHWCTPNVHSKFVERLNPGGILAANQAGKNHNKNFIDMAYVLTKREPFAKYFVNWTIPAFYPTKEEIKDVLNKAGFEEISVIEDEYKDYNYEDMIETFINASLLLFKEQLPSEELKSMFDEEFRKLSKVQPEKYKYVYRLYITARKALL